MSIPVAPIVVPTVRRSTFVIVVTSLSFVVALLSFVLVLIVVQPVAPTTSSNVATSALTQIQQRYATLKQDVATMRTTTHAESLQQLVDDANALLHAVDVTP